MAAHDSNPGAQAPKAYRPSALALILFTGFAIPVSIVAMVEFTILGMALTAYLGYLWTRLAGLQTGAPIEEAVGALVPQMGAEKAPKSSGNASFNAYRAELLNRLEHEQENFDNFLIRLRDAKDKAEFDGFMEERAEAARLVEPK